MTNYFQLTVNFTAYYSGQTYYEELYLTEDMWYEVSNKEGLYIYLHGLDGKHSESRVEVEVDKVSTEYLKNTVRPSFDGENLIESIYDNMMSDKYSYEEIDKLQDEIKELSEIEWLSIKINKNNKDKVLELINGYIV